MDERAQAIIQSVRDDRQSGAAQLALTALEKLNDWLTDGVSSQALDEVLGALESARPSMVPLANAVKRCRSRLGDHPSEDHSQHAKHVVSDVHRQLSTATDRVVDHAAGLIPESAVIFTHSSSSQVIALFQRLVQRRRRFSVICTQSSPGNEGFTLARQLDELGVPVTVITDAQTGVFISQADLALCGCDAWLADHHFVNKSGSYLMALAARDQAVPCWVLADSFKDSSATRDGFSLEELDPGELKAPEGAHITARNIYFEAVPDKLISGRVNEQGVVSFPAGPRQ